MTSGYNAAVRAAPRAPYLCLVHQDTRLLFDVERRIPAFFEEHPDAGVVGFIGSTELSPAGAWWHAGQHVGALIEGTAPRWCSAVSGFQPVDVVDGYCMFIRRDAFETLGGFDERFDHWHFYDSDLCMMAKRHGLQNYVIEGLTQHLSRGSTAPPWDAEQRKFSQKWYGTEIAPLEATAGRMKGPADGSWPRRARGDRRRKDGRTQGRKKGSPMSTAPIGWSGRAEMTTSGISRS